MNTIKKVLMFGTYPIINAQHGGQQRVSALVKAYKSAGADVRYVAVFQKNFYPDYSSTDIALAEPETPQSLLDVYTSDMQSGKRISTDTVARQRVAHLIRDYSPDVIQIEQMFPYFGLKDIIKDVGWHGKLIYSSHNIEYELKRSILSGAGVSKNELEGAVAEIREKEAQLVADSDLVVACTQADARKYERMHAKKIVVSPNGIHDRMVGFEVIQRWRNRFKKEGIVNPVLYIGSAHPPNLSGYVDMVGFGLGFMPPSSKLLFVGGVSDIIKQKLTDQPNYIQATFKLRANFLGRVSEDDLGALLSVAKTIILPITEGGGSNLKTAEAILSQKAVVATKHALRSYEAYAELPTIRVANDQRSFMTAIRQSVLEQTPNLNSSQVLLASRVSWKYALQDIVKEVMKV